MKDAQILYKNDRGEDLYILHFPGDSFFRTREFCNIRDNELTRNINISDNISIISENTKDQITNYPLCKQCDHNNIVYYNSAINERQWNNTKKINYILQDLDSIKTKYAMILDGRDVSIVNNLDDTFIQKYLQFGKSIIYNATPFAYPDAAIESLQDLMQIKGRCKFLNAGVCFGEVEALKEFYEQAKKISASIVDNHSEQLVIRHTYKRNKYLVCIDSNNTLFRICHYYDTTIETSEDNKTIILK